MLKFVLVTRQSSTPFHALACLAFVQNGSSYVCPCHVDLLSAVFSPYICRACMVLTVWAFVQNINCDILIGCPEPSDWLKCSGDLQPRTSDWLK